eukprot:Nitzschia sp. Nitz4//scaffold91_size79674//57317//58768//NITZ4_005376-RA/size79674-processed-gene-0.111-mRNA-1//-1//CDS//3329560127//8171//frame0
MLSNPVSSTSQFDADVLRRKLYAMDKIFGSPSDDEDNTVFSDEDIEFLDFNESTASFALPTPVKHVFEGPLERMIQVDRRDSPATKPTNKKISSPKKSKTTTSAKSNKSKASRQQRNEKHREKTPPKTRAISPTRSIDSMADFLDLAPSNDGDTDIEVSTSNHLLGQETPLRSNTTKEKEGNYIDSLEPLKDWLPSTKGKQQKEDRKNKKVLGNSNHSEGSLSKASSKPFSQRDLYTRKFSRRNSATGLGMSDHSAPGKVIRGPSRRTKKEGQRSRSESQPKARTARSLSRPKRPKNARSQNPDSPLPAEIKPKSRGVHRRNSANVHQSMPCLDATTNNNRPRSRRNLLREESAADLMQASNIPQNSPRRGEPKRTEPKSPESSPVQRKPKSVPDLLSSKLPQDDPETELQRRESVQSFLEKGERAGLYGISQPQDPITTGTTTTEASSNPSKGKSHQKLNGFSNLVATFRRTTSVRNLGSSN